jgi:type IV pilus assembly protein PilB
MTAAFLDPPVLPPPSAGAARSHDAPLPLGEQLVQAGGLTAVELDAALGHRAQKRLQLGEALLEMGFVDEATLVSFLGSQVRGAAVRLREGLVDPAVVRLIPRAKAEALCVLAMFRVRGVLSVAVTEPRNLTQIDELERITGLTVRPVLALRSSIERLLPRCYEEDFSVDAVTADLAQDAVEVQAEAIDVQIGDIDSLAEGSPIINLVNYMIVNALRQGASDIHIEAGHRHSMVRFRVDGQLREVLHPRRDFHPALVSRLKVMAKLDISEQRLPQDGRIHVLVEGREIDLRISTLPTICGEKVVMRVLDRRNVTFNLDKLGLPEHLLPRMKDILARPHGLVLVTGPTGSGKTTTLYSAVELIKSVHRNIVTVEDPVEYQLDQINQVQVGASKAMSFAGALRSILRQDPDVIMVGEIRDAETAMVAIQAALTGHLVLSTLHTNDAAGAVTRLHDMGVEPFKIAAALVGVVAQRLVRTICPACRTTYYPPAEILDTLHYAGDRRKQFARGEGCRACYDTGFKGRLGVYEILWASRAVRQVINENPNLEAIRAAHLAQGGTLLLNEGLRLAEEGLTSLDEVIRVAYCD